MHMGTAGRHWYKHIIVSASHGQNLCRAVKQRGLRSASCFFVGFNLAQE